MLCIPIRNVALTSGFQRLGLFLGLRQLQCNLVFAFLVLLNESMHGVLQD